MGLYGRFRFWLPNGEEVEQWNTLTIEGEAEFLKMIARDNQTVVAAGANYYIGLMGAVADANLILATLAGEPAVANGYARKAVARNAVGWPTADIVSGIHRIASLVQTFTAAGGDFSVAFSRAFLTSAAAGTVGTLFAFSGALAAPVLVVNGAHVDVQYELFLR